MERRKLTAAGVATALTFLVLGSGIWWFLELQQTRWEQEQVMIGAVDGPTDETEPAPAAGAEPEGLFWELGASLAATRDASPRPPRASEGRREGILPTVRGLVWVGKRMAVAFRHLQDRHRQKARALATRGQAPR
jgi:hypothetical protein